MGRPNKEAMINKVVTKLFGTRFDRERKKLWPVVEQIHGEEERLKDLSEEPQGPDGPVPGDPVGPDRRGQAADG